MCVRFFCLNSQILYRPIKKGRPYTWDEVTGSWIKLHNEELHGLYSSPSIIRVIKARRMRWAGHVTRMGDVRGEYNILVGKPEGRRPLGRPRRRWEVTLRWILGK
jgi:hypothetical protein